MDDITALIRQHLALLPVPLIPEIVLHRATDAAQLSWLPPEPAPYWAYVWPGGAAVARHVLDHPELVRGKRVLDLGAGSGLLGVAACKAEAASVSSVEIDHVGRTAIALNAEANGVSITIIADDLLPGAAPTDVDVVLVGDLLYERDLADAVIPFLVRCRNAGITVLLGDPGRGHLPLSRVRYLAEYGAGSVDDDRDSPTTPAAVFAFE